MSQFNSKKPAFVKGLMWGAFSGTAMLSAFILPIHLYALLMGYDMRLENVWYILYFVILFGSALYHGIYRFKTILFDLGLMRKE